MYQEIEFMLQAVLFAGLASGFVSVVAGFVDLVLLKRGFRRTWSDLVNIFFLGIVLGTAFIVAWEMG